MLSRTKSVSESFWIWQSRAERCKVNKEHKLSQTQSSDLSNTDIVAIALRRAVKAVRGSAPRERLEAPDVLARLESAEPLPLALENAVAALREAYYLCGGDRDACLLMMLAEFYFVSGRPGAAMPPTDRAVAAAEALASGVGGTAAKMTMEGMAMAPWRRSGRRWQWLAP